MDAVTLINVAVLAATLVGFIAILVVLLVAAERSLRRQKGNMLKRDREEQQAARRASANQAHWSGGRGLGL